MPVWLRNFTFGAIRKHFNELKDIEERPQEPSQQVKVPTYTTKARK